MACGFARYRRCQRSSTQAEFRDFAEHLIRLLGANTARAVLDTAEDSERTRRVNIRMEPDCDGASQLRMIEALRVELERDHSA